MATENSKKITQQIKQRKINDNSIFQLFSTFNINFTGIVIYDDGTHFSPYLCTCTAVAKYQHYSKQLGLLKVHL